MYYVGPEFITNILLSPLSNVRAPLSVRAPIPTGIQCWSQHLGPFHPLLLRWLCLSLSFLHEQLMPGLNSAFSHYL